MFFFFITTPRTYSCKDSSGHIKIQLHIKFITVLQYSKQQTCLIKTKQKPKKDYYTQNIEKQLNKQVWHFRNFIV